jgi:4-diphosphocytidyl-2-C-methyl-D-erythritol kinase
MERSSIKILAYAKLNLGLSILGKREDGYHELKGLMQTIDLADTLTLKEDTSFRVKSEIKKKEEENLVFKAAKLILGKRRGAVISLHKNIPIGAGLGGGSSDAAATLVGLNELFGLRMTKEELKELGAMIGSDVPFFFEGGLCEIGGRGEIVKRLPSLNCYFVVIAPPFCLNTKEVYHEFDRLFVKTKSFIIKQKLRGYLKNDLEAAALSLLPQLKEYREFFKGADFWGMSGSGPSFYGGFESKGKAEEFAQRAKLLKGKVFLCKAIDKGYKKL